MTSPRPTASASFLKDPLARIPSITAVLAVCVVLLVVSFVAGFLRGSPFSAPLILYYAAVASILVAVLPAIVALRARGRIDPFHPLAYFAWSFFLPNFALAGMLAASGMRYTGFSWLLITPGQSTTSPYTARTEGLGVAVLGTIGLATGFFAVKYFQDRARKLADGEGVLPERAPGRLRTWSASFLSGSPHPMAVAILLIAGFAALINAMQYGLFGYRVSPPAVPSYVPVLAFFGQWVVLGVALVIGGTAAENRGGYFRLLLILTVLAAVALFAISGARGFLYRCVLVAFAADQYVRPRLSFKRLLVWLLALVISVGLAMTYGTAYRRVRNITQGRTAQTTVQSEAALAAEVARKMASEMKQSVVKPKPQPGVKPAQPAPAPGPGVGPPKPSEMPKLPTGPFERAFFHFSERLVVGLNDLSIIVKYADVHQAEEVRLGIDRNIQTDLFRSFVPRFLWPGKPIVGPSEVISRLYFGQPNHQPAVTYMGDLYRNYRLPGVFIGMTFFGALIACLYGALIVEHPNDPLRTAIWIMLLLSFNFENLFSIVVPNLSRTTFVAAVGILIARIGMNRSKPGDPEALAIPAAGPASASAMSSQTPLA